MTNPLITQLSNLQIIKVMKLLNINISDFEISALGSALKKNHNPVSINENLNDNTKNDTIKYVYVDEYNKTVFYDMLNDLYTYDIKN